MIFLDKKTIIWLVVTNISQAAIIILIVVFMQPRAMLDARTIYQINNSKALKKLNAFTPAEECEMKAAFEKAQYYNEPNIFADAVCEEK